MSDLIQGDGTGFGVTWGRWPDPPTQTVEVSPYAMQHPEHYALRPTTRYGGKIVHVELVLMDIEWDPIDEDGCNCDLDSPCNNPKCVMERRRW